MTNAIAYTTNYDFGYLLVNIIVMCTSTHNSGLSLLKGKIISGLLANEAGRNIISSVWK